MYRFGVQICYSCHGRVLLYVSVLCLNSCNSTVLVGSPEQDYQTAHAQMPAVNTPSSPSKFRLKLPVAELVMVSGCRL